MKCRNPFIRGVHAYACGRCIPCLVQKRRIWTHRIMLEAMQHTSSVFVTLTYTEDQLPRTGDGSQDLPTLNPKDLQDWLKRFRKKIAPLKIRFYGCGEYGDNTHRPHYHVAVFGYPQCRYGRSRYTIKQGSSVVTRASCCPACDVIRDTWSKDGKPLGHVLVGNLSMKSAQYVAGYVTKKMTKAEDVRLRGRHPEFARMSNRPGIGADALHDVASVLMTLGLDTSQPDVPSALQYGKKMMPLGRYLRRRLRKLVGKDEATPPEVLAQAGEEVRALLLNEEFLRSGHSIKKGLFQKSEGEILATEARERIYKQRRTI